MVPSPPIYVPLSSRRDEAFDQAGARPLWGDLLAGMTTHSQATANRLMAAEGASQLGYEDDVRVGSQLDPLPVLITASEWSKLERGLAERTELFNEILTDLYGPQRLITDGVIPPEALAACPNFAMSAVGIPTHSPRLAVHACDVVRSAHGSWVVLHDSVDEATALGALLLDRAVSARVSADPYRELKVQPLTPFFVALRDALGAMAPPGVVSPRTVVLSGGPGNVGFVEHAYLAARLGYHVAGGADLMVRQGRLWLRSLGGAEPIDVVLHGLSDTDTDPLEFGGRAGVPGLLQAVREGTVSVANALGTNVVGEPLLFPFLAAAARMFLGREMTLETAHSVWCGEPTHQREVSADLSPWVLSDIAHREPTVFGHDLRDDTLRRWQSLIARRPERVIAQRYVTTGTTPALTSDGSLVASEWAMRTLTVRSASRTVVAPGAVARLLSPVEPLAMQSSAVIKDVWIAGLAHPATRSRVSPLPQVDLSASLPTHSAEALFWVGRNAERAETVGRFTRTVIQRYELAPDLAHAHDGQWISIAVRALRSVSGGTGTDTVTDGDGLHRELCEALDQRPGALADTLGHLLSTATAVRGFLSTATWPIIGVLAEERHALLHDPQLDDMPGVGMSLDRILLGLSALTGLTQESMVRGPGWVFLDLGRRLDRSIALLGAIEAVVGIRGEPEVIGAAQELLLACCESLVAYRRRFRSDVETDALCTLLLADITNPRSLAFQLDRMTELLRQLPSSPRTGDHLALVASARSAIAGSFAPGNLTGVVLNARGALLKLAGDLVQAWFATIEPMRGTGQRYR